MFWLLTSFAMGAICAKVKYLHLASFVWREKRCRWHIKQSLKAMLVDMASSSSLQSGLTEKLYHQQNAVHCQKMKIINLFDVKFRWRERAPGEGWFLWCVLFDLRFCLCLCVCCSDADDDEQKATHAFSSTICNCISLFRYQLIQ